jgi:hypothetical protein
VNDQTWFVQTSVASLIGLIVLNIVMLASYLAGVEPHPPAVLGPLGGAGPFIGANVALSTVGALYCWWQNRVGYILAMVSVLLNIITFGPHKYFQEAASLLYPAVTVGTILSVALFAAGVAGLRRTAGHK